MRLPSDSPLPEYDPASGQNRYEWILESARALRAQRQAQRAIYTISAYTPAERAAMRQHDTEVEAEESERFVRLRECHNDTSTARRVARQKKRQPVESEAENTGL